MRYLILAAFLAFGLATVGCNKPAPQANAPAPAEQPKPKLLLGSADPFQDVRSVAVNQTLTVVLSENPAAPTKWMIESKPAFIKLSDESKKTYGPTEQVRRFVFKAEAPGNGEIVFVLRDGTAPNAPVLQTFKVYVIAQ